jgi:uncharacterized membrane protein YtjA (UPF0391 family)
MLNFSIAFFVLGIVSMFLGLPDVSALSVEAGKALLLAFLVLAIVSFLASLATDAAEQHSPHLPQ